MINPGPEVIAVNLFLDQRADWFLILPNCLIHQSAAGWVAELVVVGLTRASSNNSKRRLDGPVCDHAGKAF